MATRQEIEAQIQALQKELEGADDGTELWIEDEKGRKTKLTGPHAKRWLRNLGLDDDEAPADGSGDGAEGDQQDPPPAGGSSVWGRKAK